jgi:hypothetical protein
MTLGGPDLMLPIGCCLSADEVSLVNIFYEFTQVNEGRYKLGKRSKKQCDEYVESHSVMVGMACFHYRTLCTLAGIGNLP